MSRVLLSEKLKNSLDKDMLTELFNDVEITKSDLDAVWFSRPSKHGKTAWEIRLLDLNPFALMAVFERNDNQKLRDETLEDLEKRLKIYADKNSEEINS